MNFGAYLIVRIYKEKEALAPTHLDTPQSRQEELQ